MKNAHTIVGVDLGGTKVLAARIREKKIEKSHKTLVSAQGTEQQVILEVITTIEAVITKGVEGIGVGVPSIVDINQGIVYDVQNIPSWKEVHLKKKLEDHFGVPVYVNNDANCFAIGEKYFGEGRGYANMIGLIVGTGLAAGIIFDHKLYNGFNGGAGEFGMLPYLDRHFEYYAAGQFFSNVYGMDGGTLHQQALNGDTKALGVFQEFGHHLGQGIMAILYAMDPELIVLGGSVSQAYPIYQKTLWEAMRAFAYTPVVDRLTIKLSKIPQIAVLGAAALFFDAQNRV